MTTITTTLRRSRDDAKLLRSQQFSGIASTNIQDALEAINGGGGGGGGGGAIVTKSINFASSPYNVLAGDSYLLVDTTGGAITINMLAAAARLGIPLIIKDVTGHAANNAISVVASGAETIDNLATFPIETNFEAVKFSPTAGGYFIDA